MSIRDLEQILESAQKEVESYWEALPPGWVLRVHRPGPRACALHSQGVQLRRHMTGAERAAYRAIQGPTSVHKSMPASACVRLCNHRRRRRNQLLKDALRPVIAFLSHLMPMRMDFLYRLGAT